VWTYLAQSFLYAYPGFADEEIDPWKRMERSGERSLGRRAR
jgi:hypothetical protein